MTLKRSCHSPEPCILTSILFSLFQFSFIEKLLWVVVVVVIVVVVVTVMVVVMVVMIVGGGWF
jgi:hypothetical protein